MHMHALYYIMHMFFTYTCVYIYIAIVHIYIASCSVEIAARPPAGFVKRAAEECTWEAKVQLQSISVALATPPIDIGRKIVDRDCEFPNSNSAIDIFASAADMAMTYSRARCFELDNEWEHVEC